MIVIGLEIKNGIVVEDWKHQHEKQINNISKYKGAFSPCIMYQYNKSCGYSYKFFKKTDYSKILIYLKYLKEVEEIQDNLIFNYILKDYDEKHWEYGIIDTTVCSIEKALELMESKIKNKNDEDMILEVIKILKGVKYVKR